jgi:ABC-type phosphate transport system substrate-binding protein
LPATVVAVALCAFGFALFANQPSYGARAPSAHAKPAPLRVVPRVVTAANGLTAQVAPATDIVNQVVQVSWSGFHPTDQLGNYDVLVYQCTASPKSLSDCFTVPPYPNAAGGNSIVNAVTGSDGTGNTFFEVRNSSVLPQLNCSSTSSCSLLVWENDGTPPPTDGLPATSVVVPIAFARSSNDCPVPNGFDVRAEGEASGSNLFYNWIGQLCEGNPKLVIDYTGDASDNGRASEIGGFTDIGVTSLGATSTELAASTTKTSYLYAPLDLNSVVVVFHINDAVTNEPITSVTLTPRLLARLITDSDLLDFFTDPEFLKLNPGHHWPSLGASQPLLRAERNADTWLITDWMIQDPDAKAFVAGKDKYSVAVTPDFLNQQYPVPNFEKAASDDGFDPLTGEALVAQHMFYGVKPADSTVTRPSTEGFFGIMDRDTATQWGLPMAKLVNHAGQAVAPDETSVLQGYKDMTALNGVKVANFASTDPAAYPLTKIDYAMVRQKITKTNLDTGALAPDLAKVTSLKTFLDWESTTGQQHLLEGYIPLPAAEVAQTKKVASEITVGSGTPPATTTTTTAATTPLADAGGCCGGSGGDLGGSNSGSPDTMPPTSTPPTTNKTKSKPNTPKVKLVAAEAPAWSPVGAGGRSTTPSPLWFVLVFGIAALAARLAWYTSPKVVSRVRARAAARNGDKSNGARS